MLYSKGVEILFNAGQILFNKGYTNFIINALGDSGVDNPDSIPVALLHEWSKEYFFSYVGRTDHVSEFYKKAHCVVLASYYREGVPRSLLEAISIGRPIITTNSTGCREVVINEKNGFLVKPKDATDLAVKMEMILNMSHEELNILGIESRKIAEDKFDEKIVLQSYVHKINKVYEKNSNNRW